MSQAQPSRSATDRHARSFAAAIGSGRMPARSTTLESYLENSPHEIFAAFEGVARHMPPAGNDADLAFGYLFLLQGLLERLRYRTECGHPDAVRLVAAFQADIAERCAAGHLDGKMLAYVSGVLHQAKIPVAPELAAISTRPQATPQQRPPLPDDIRVAAADMLEACGGDPFAFAGALSELGHALPAAARGALAAMLALGGEAGARAAAVLLLLDPDLAVRDAVAGALGQVATSLSPDDLRRLIAIRNWRPATERAGVDAVIAKAKAAGIAAAPWPAGSAEAIHATAIDGAEAQGFLLVAPAGKKKRLSTILLKRGIADASIGEPESKGRIKAVVTEAQVPMFEVSRPYLDRMVGDGLARTIEQGGAPPFGLLEVAEAIGGADWQPLRMELGETLAGLIAALPESMRGAAAVQRLLRQSGELADLVFVAESWFEDDAETARALDGARGVKREKLADDLLQSVIGRRRDKWADLFLRTALWMREAPDEAGLCWRELAITARALLDGRDMREIGLMRGIALRTIAAARDRRFARG